MASPAVLRSVLILRIFTLLALTASVLVMGLNNFKTLDGTDVIFTDLIAYRYVFACGVTGFVYTLIQIPFAAYNAAKDKRWIRNGCLQEFDFYGDKVMGFLLASGVGVGFGVSCELKRTFGGSLSDKTQKFLDWGNISTGLLLGGFVFMAFLSILSSNRHTSSATRTRTFFQ